MDTKLAEQIYGICSYYFALEAIIGRHRFIEQSYNAIVKLLVGGICPHKS